MSLTDFAPRFDRLIGKVEGLDVRVPEDSALIGLATDLVPRVTRMLAEGVDLLTAIEKYYSARREEADRFADSGSETLSDIGLMFASEFAARDVIDLTFFARSDLRAAHESLMAAATRKDGVLNLASLCEAGLRRLRKALVSVESAVYEFEDRPAPERHWFDVQVSLQIRRLYWNLRRETTKGPVSDVSLERRLRAALYQIVAFRELSVYPFLRVDDRVEMRELMSRILEWLNSDERDPVEGRRLWQDLSSFAELLVQVSHREELRDHDREVVALALDSLFGRRFQPSRVPPEVRTKLETLLGLDDDLDALIMSQEPAPVEAWREPLESLQINLRPGRKGHKAPPELWMDD